MSTTFKHPTVSRSQLVFATCAALFIAIAFVFTATAPVAMSIGIVFLFAGPHNYVEARYFLTRLPARMGRLRTFFVTSAAGILILTMTFPLLTRLPSWMAWPQESALWTIGLWNTALILWCTTLIWLRSLQPPRKNWDYALPIGLGITGLTWLQPVLLPLLLVFLHPLLGLWVLDREICRSRAEWQSIYRGCLGLLPPLLILLWTIGPIESADSLLFEISPGLHRQITHHTGAPLLKTLNPDRLIATHAFLELLHYGVWIIAVPAASGRVFSRTFRSIPLMKRSVASRKAISFMLTGSAVTVAVLWLCFTANYSTTRDIYFTVATLHVLAEVPFLLRLL